MNIVDEIKEIAFNYIENSYQNYLHNNNLLLIKKEKLSNVINEIYNNESKELKHTIRSKLKEKHKKDYPSASVENIILDIFQDKTFNIQKTIDEIAFIQKKNIKILTIPLINQSLNLNISLIDNFVLINSIKSKANIETFTLELYNIIENYKFLYSINDTILNEVENNEKINTIKNIIEEQKKVNKNEINIELYYLKNNKKIEIQTKE
tara:strand:+ start:23 stop:646 length:624 start_codon:yes stop_codon:yes gene_type:complete